MKGRNSKMQQSIFENMFATKLTSDEKVTVINFGSELYRDGLKDGFWFAVGGYVTWKVGKWLVASYIDYKAEAKAKEISTKEAE